MRMYKNNSKERLYTVEDLKSGVQRLDAYINNCEKVYKNIPVSKNLSKRHTYLLNYIDRLMEVIGKEKVDKKKAFEHLKASNQAMEETISKLQDSTKTYRQSKRAEFKKLDTLNTERLLNIDPRNI